MNKNLILRLVLLLIFYFVVLISASATIWFIYLNFNPVNIKDINSVSESIMKLSILLLSGLITGYFTKSIKENFILVLLIALSSFALGSTKGEAHFTAYPFLNIMRYPYIFLTLILGFLIKVVILNIKRKREGEVQEPTDLS